MTQKPSGFKEHQVMLCLDKEPYHGFIQIQADRDLGRSYAGLLPFVEGLYHLGYISKEGYDAHFKKYSEPLISARAYLKPSSVEYRILLIHCCYTILDFAEKL